MSKLTKVVVFNVPTQFRLNNIYQRANTVVVYLGFRKGGRGTEVVGCGERSGEGAVPPAQKKNHFYVPKI